TSTTETRALSLHDALPISWTVNDDPGGCGVQFTRLLLSTDNTVFETNGSYVNVDSVTLTLGWGNTYYYKIAGTDHVDQTDIVTRSEEHTSELQSRENLVCR